MESIKTTGFPSNLTQPVTRADARTDTRIPLSMG